MSITTKAPGDGEKTELELIQKANWPLPDGVQCFYCYNPIKSVGVMWVGSTDEHLYLHPACVFSLFTRLVRDVHEIECKLGVNAWEIKQ